MDENQIMEDVLYHDQVEGWHHHHTEAGVVLHLDGARGSFTDDDGSLVIFSSHRADHDEILNTEEPCRLTDEYCAFAMFVPAFTEWVTYPEGTTFG
jgi:hypothetical protein